MRILKNGCNTRWWPDALAKFLKIHAREVSFARKIKRRLEQVALPRVPGNAMPGFKRKFELGGL